MMVNVKMKKVIRGFTRKLLVFKDKLIVRAILICLLISVIPFGIFSYITYHNTLNILIEEYIGSNQKTLVQGSKVIENDIQHLKDVALRPYKDIRFLLNLTDVNGEFLKASYNDNFLKDMFFYNEDIDTIYFYTTRSGMLYYYSKYYSGKRSINNIENEHWYQKTVNNPHGLYISPTHKFIDYIGVHTSKHDQVYSVNQSIINIETGEVLGVIELNIAESIIKDFAVSLKDEDEAILILNSEGEAIYSDEMPDQMSFAILSKEQTLIGENGYFELDVSGDKYIVIYNSFQENMLLAKIISYSQFEKEAIASIKGILLSSTIIILLILLLVVYIITSINIQIRQIEVNMERISSGDFDINMTYKRNDELAKFIHNFNDMAHKIRRMIDSEYKSKIALKNAQILALQTQINPHFMFNSLQVVSAIALKEGSETTYKMLSAIANLLNYSLGKKNNSVSLLTEVEYTQNYLYVQEMRFGAKLNVEYDLDDNISEVKIPRLILQPLVENSLSHGVSDPKESISIWVSTREENGYCKIAVKDNGKGIEPQILKEINSWIYAADYLLKDENHIGLLNVITRLRLIYDDNALIEVTSEVGKGTYIVIGIPL